jgi:hypothetical protein
LLTLILYFMLGICSQWRGGAHLPSAECLFQQWISQLILISPILHVISSSLLSNALYQFLYSGWNCYFLTSSAKHEASNISLSFINNLEFHLQLRFRECISMSMNLESHFRNLHMTMRTIKCETLCLLIDCFWVYLGIVRKTVPWTEKNLNKKLVSRLLAEMKNKKVK